jgi:hypothetical protein
LQAAILSCKRPLRPRPFLVASLIIVVLVALGGVTYYATAPKGAGGTSSASSSLSASSMTCGTVTLNATDVSSTNCQLGLTFTLSIKSSAIEPGKNLTVEVSIRNDLSSNRNVTFTGARPCLAVLLLALQNRASIFFRRPAVAPTYPVTSQCIIRRMHSSN